MTAPIEQSLFITKKPFFHPLFLSGWAALYLS
jgi:hypothetical protein